MIEPSAAPRQTARWLELVYDGRPDPFDPAECYHEASKVSPTQIGRQVAGAARLEATPDLQLSMTRAVGVCRFPHRRYRRAGAREWRSGTRSRSGVPVGNSAPSRSRFAISQPCFPPRTASPTRSSPTTAGTRFRCAPSPPAARSTRSSSMSRRSAWTVLVPGSSTSIPSSECSRSRGSRSAPTTLLRSRPIREIVAGAAAVIFRGRLRPDALQVRRARLPIRSARGWPRRSERPPGRDRARSRQPCRSAATTTASTDEFLGLDGVNESTLYSIAVGAMPRD